MIDLTVTYVERMKAHETAIRDLYRSFAAALPPAAAFWTRLALEESAHVDVLVALAGKVAEGTLAFQPRTFTMHDVRESFEFIQRAMDDVDRGAVDKASALSTALILERGIVEHDFFRVFEGDAPAVKAEFEALRRHTEEHARRLESER